jgi:hypothetical protein
MGPLQDVYHLSVPLLMRGERRLLLVAVRVLPLAMVWMCMRPRASQVRWMAETLPASARP